MLSVKLQTLYFKHFGYIGESLNFWFSLVSIQKELQPYWHLNPFGQVIPHYPRASATNKVGGKPKRGAQKTVTTFLQPIGEREPDRGFNPFSLC